MDSAVKRESGATRHMRLRVRCQEQRWLARSFHTLCESTQNARQMAEKPRQFQFAHFFPRKHIKSRANDFKRECCRVGGGMLAEGGGWVCECWVSPIRFGVIRQCRKCQNCRPDKMQKGETGRSLIKTVQCSKRKEPWWNWFNSHISNRTYYTSGLFLLRWSLSETSASLDWWG